MRVDPVKLIQFIVCQATKFGASLTPIRVVKFLYLADLYHARENKGETLTGWPWKFVYFGPYCTESFLALRRAVDDGLMEAKPFESKYDWESVAGTFLSHFSKLGGKIDENPKS
jgi:hypothetical protein